MSKDPIASWMISPKSFISLLGAEYHLMRDARVLKRFYVSSVLIIIILLMTWISIKYAFDLLFHALIVEIILAIFFSLLFFCTYIFLLNTFAKEARAQKSILNLSNVIRIGFVLYMGLLIAQPLIILLYSASLTPAVEGHKQMLFSKHTEKVSALMAGEIKALITRKRYCLKQKELLGTSIYNNELKKIDAKLKTVQSNEDNLNQTAKRAIEQSSFFLYRVEKTNHDYPVSWLLTLLIVLLFLSPGYLIYSISSQHEYYRLKKAREKELIIAAYNSFTTHYTKLFNEQIAIFSRYEDPPFNTIRKQPPIPASMTEFLKKYISNG